ncbi:site-specific DNA-methyltransferase [Microbacterium esteraromaticum]|uniref:Methyltransferase n=1 Tax=Microbacterium esteraromaticum TaxID=57043 RepID=A0A7D7WBY5_9MICO|nr:site-specific DNA-methyltransferase [Microbacterium esteraromaticum]QMU97818.1 site-specific DNA-methyltransferase [Microbacterium esteraromaticum]
MSIYYDSSDVQLHHGDALEVARTLPDGMARTIVTSPPYYGLRDYGEDGQIGAEASVGEYVARMVEVFRELRRVLADDGTFWLNIGDSYLSDGLAGVPWRLALALKEDGWSLRADVIWHKPKVLPESIKNRPTRSHEHIFMFAKVNSGYFYDHESVREAGAEASTRRYEAGFGGDKATALRAAGIRIAVEGKREYDGMRSLRDVWSVSPVSFPGAHFATYPPDLIRPCIRAGSEPGDIVLDPFSGSGTTGAVATFEGRRYVGIDLNREYLDLSLRTRFQQPALPWGEAS